MKELNDFARKMLKSSINKHLQILTRITQTDSQEQIMAQTSLEASFTESLAMNYILRSGR